MSIADDLRTGRFLRHFATNSFAIFGIVALILQTSDVLFPEATYLKGLNTLLGVILLSIVGGMFLSWPRPITEQYSSPNTKITIAKGNLLEEKSHLVIGTVDTFDTETPVIIASSSLQGQALQELYGGDLHRLDSHLDNALVSRDIVDTVEKSGKQSRYGIGTVATVHHAARLIFFLAYCEMDFNNNAHSTPDKLWSSLGMLWDEISLRGNGATVSMPVIGGGRLAFRA